MKWKKVREKISQNKNDLEINAVSKLIKGEEVRMEMIQTEVKDSEAESFIGEVNERNI